MYEVPFIHSLGHTKYDLKKNDGKEQQQQNDQKKEGMDGSMEKQMGG